MKSGCFITFEGGEGCGKTTQLRLLADHLRSVGYEVISTREPGGTEIGSEIRSILLKERQTKFSSMAELLLFYADRAQHLEELVLPFVQAGKVVLCDRFNDSTLAYQGARGIPPHHLEILTDLVLDGLKPDLTLFFDPGEEEAKRRMGWRNAVEGVTDTRIDNETEEFHKAVWMRFRKLCLSQPEGRYRKIDSSGSIEATQEITRKCVLGFLQAIHAPA